MVMVVYSGNGDSDFHLQVMVVGMLHHPTIFYYPAIAVATVMVAVKVFELIIWDCVSKQSKMMVFKLLFSCWQCLSTGRR